MATKPHSMKRTWIYSLIVLLISTSSCSQINLKKLQEASDKAETVIFGPSSTLSNDEVVAGLREALEVGTKNAVDVTSKLDGFYKDPEITIPFPPDAMKVKEKAEQLGFSNQVQKFEETLNRAAEQAAVEATEVFVAAIKGMSIEDGFNILKGEDDAATQYLRTNATGELSTRFSPIIDKAIDDVELTKYWQPLITAYNSANLFGGGEEINPDLNAFVLERAMDGLFFYIQKEEKNIRDNPAARITDLLQKVFGQQ